MAYMAKCPICKEEKFYDSTKYRYLYIKGAREYVCVECEKDLMSKGTIIDVENPKIIYTINVHQAKRESDSDELIPVQRITFTRFDFQKGNG